jgi:hypothetical protein
MMLGYQPQEAIGMPVWNFFRQSYRICKHLIDLQSNPVISSRSTEINSEIHYTERRHPLHLLVGKYSSG